MINFPNFVFFGTDEFAVTVLDELGKVGCRPELIVTTPDQPQGKHLLVSPPPVKIWAEKNKIPYFQPENLKSISRPDLEEVSRSGLGNAELFLVASYGKILPPEILSIPKYGVLNIHPSLLPAYRGPTPIQTAILNGATKSGVTLMLLDAELDHGPIIAAHPFPIANYAFPAARCALAQAGAKLFLDTAPYWVTGEIKALPQNHNLATYTNKIKKEDGLINLSPGDTLGNEGVALHLLNYRKFLAYRGWPGVYFFVERNGEKVRVIITAAHIVNNQFIIERVKPEGKRDMPYPDFQRGFKVPKSA